MRFLSMFLVVFAFLAVSACTGTDTVTVIKCPEGSTLTGDECIEDEPDDSPPVTRTPPPSQQTPPPSQEPEPPSDCNLFATGTARYNGSDGDDRICGNERTNDIDAGDGDDVVYGQGGNDEIRGNIGDDRLEGGPGDDTLIGGDDRDTLIGDAGNDILVGGEDNDKLDGGEGSADTVDYCREYYGNATPSNIVPTSSCETPVTDPVTTITFNNDNGVEVDLSQGIAERDTYGREDDLTNIENVKGTPQNDTILGDDKANRIYGFAGDDTINGRGGNDVIDGGGQAGDMLDGGEGNDTIILRGTLPDDTFKLAAEDDNAENFENITSMLPAATAVTLEGNSGPNTIIGGEGVDTIRGGAGTDMLDGGKGDDVIHNGPGINTLTGSEGADSFMIDAIDADADTISDFTITDVATELDTITCTLETEDEDAFLAISKKEISVTADRNTREITAVKVEVAIAENKRELVINEVYSEITTKANASATPAVEEVIMERTRKLRTLVNLKGLSSDDSFTLAGASACSKDKS